MSKESEKPIKAKVLVVDDDKFFLQTLGDSLTEKGFEPTLAMDGEEAERRFGAEEFDVVLTDIMMPKVDGLELLRRIKDRDPEIPVIIVTGSGDDKIQANAWERGAFLYITKPIDYNFLNLAIRQAVDKFSLVKKNRELSEASERDFENIIGISDRMREVFSLISKVASSNASILIHGESGTGKELVAKAIHDRSSRKDNSFIAVNCAAIPKELMESELFGHAKGSFTGAISDKKGKFELADGGSIFLDEIGDLDISLQAKILRALQEREFERVGGTKPIRVNIRLIAATNKDLSQAMKEGSFREDLFYRLSVIPLLIPPLRDRGREDVRSLSDHFLIKYNLENGKNIKDIDSEAMKALETYDWPGNVRELENCMERAVVMAETDRIRLSDLPPAVRSGKMEQTGARGEGEKGAPWQIGRPMREIEREYILRTLEEMKGNRTRAAEVLGISVRGLRDKLKEYGYSSAHD